MKKSPLKDKPLREPGQSVQQQIEELRDLDINFYIVAAGLLLMFVAFEWYQKLRTTPLDPTYITVLSLFFIAFCIYKIITTKKKLKFLKLGRDGEKNVAEELEVLKESGCRVFHDIVGQGFNLDHVIISEKGIFVVETKTRSKPAKGRAVIEYDGGVLKANGHVMTPDPLVQAKAAASWLKNMLKDTTGKNYPVKAAIVFPGWFVENKSHSDKNNIWVLNPKGLPSFINHLPGTIPTEDVQLAAYHLSRYIRVSY